MSSETTMMLHNTVFRGLADQGLPEYGISAARWCACHGITKANYYYQLCRVRKACLEAIREEIPVKQMVPVQPVVYSRVQLSDSACC